ncbi:hypothetical protein GU927_017175 [Rhodobacteraceae bacterium HSP-20]|jgi:hypothetical protein|uniref:Lipoprotein n=1 Tax=Paragemmobacter amnigenus TaxID=2852097 RepID=A0ABS6J761_9RHOB|nr:hypothetical protein [Rhodobacter amnigenus]MBU9699579.1 hypothetical protein [Rhodobacter amnigenus]MBV4390806.1 hypothetical protein [Rhodobacter amnigenus]
MRGLWFLALLGLVACGPIPVERAEQQCLGRAQLAAKPRGMVSAGVNSDGDTLAGLKLEVSSDYIMGRDPSAVFDLCVQQKSGQPPTRPLYSFPEWKG